MQRTVNYDLCQYEGSDKTSYLINYNGDMLKIDTAIKAAKDAADNAQATASGADGKADSVAADVSTLNTQINGASGLAADVATVQGSVNTINSLIGNGEPTTTNKTLIGAINELNSDKCADSKVGDLSNLTTTDKSSVVAAINEIAGGQGGAVDADDVTFNNTASGLAATNVQDAIDELAQGGAVAEYQDVDVVISNVSGSTSMASEDVTTDITSNAPSGFEPDYAVQITCAGMTTLATLALATDSKWYFTHMSSASATLTVTIRMRYKKSA